ncbi:MAG: hypothetical protein EZS28_010211 [Streblomastix strix]|uniref:Uncharacterized protein n=1 Tax=Streblomastix strix TaxID=222440 RepID=A0A5J4WI53_9EUKA|nr:MAG: hypothetical protein EZS28_010211 [Streblomastix strix]
MFPLAAAVAFTSGTFAILGSTLRGCQCVALVYILAVPATPAPVSFRAQVLAVPSSPVAISAWSKKEETYKGCQWSTLAYSVLMPAAPTTLSTNSTASLAWETQSGTTYPLLYHFNHTSILSDSRH